MAEVIPGPIDAFVLAGLIFHLDNQRIPLSLLRICARLALLFGFLIGLPIGLANIAIQVVDLPDHLIVVIIPSLVEMALARLDHVFAYCAFLSALVGADFLCVQNFDVTYVLYEFVVYAVRAFVLDVTEIVFNFLFGFLNIGRFANFLDVLAFQVNQGRLDFNNFRFSFRLSDYV